MSKTNLRLNKRVKAENTHKFRGGGCEAEAGQADFMSTLSTGHQAQSHIKALQESTCHGLVQARHQHVLWEAPEDTATLCTDRAGKSSLGLTACHIISVTIFTETAFLGPAVIKNCHAG